jgi:hypothetical protein
MKRSNIKRSIKHKDPVTQETAAAVYGRDISCIAGRIGMPGICGSQFGPQANPPLELDHVNGSGLGKRGPSIPENLVLLCGLHHRMKTEQARVWRPVINEYLKGRYS